MLHPNMPAEVGLAGVSEVQLCSLTLCLKQVNVLHGAIWQHWQASTFSVP